MEDDYIDEDGNISIWRLLTMQRYPEDDPRHMSTTMRHWIAQQRWTQLEIELARNLDTLRKLDRRQP